MFSDIWLSNSQDRNAANFPRAILSVSRQECDRLPLTVKRGLSDDPGQLPDDLQGRLFVISPVGDLDSDTIGDTPVVLPSANGWTPLFNGDGMVYRLDFDSPGAASLSAKIVKTPCYYADRATGEQERYRDLRFKNIGFGRLSYNQDGVRLGFRNQLNTAFVPVKFDRDQGDRLLVTWDTGRPYEIDPDTLELIAPIGWNRDWQELTKIPGKTPPFRQLLTSAHPGFAPEDGGALFTVNVGKSLSTILWLSRSLEPQLKKLLALLKRGSLKRLVWVLSVFLQVFKLIEKLFSLLDRGDFVHLLRWDGRGIDVEQWKLIRDNGCPIKIRQTLHQMGTTRDYIVLADTAFKFDLQEILPYVENKVLTDLEILGIDLFDYPQLPYTDLYIVPRAKLKPGRNRVKVRHTRIPLAMAHYLVDYENPDDKITLHAAHICATDPSETLRDCDRSVFKDRRATNNLQQLPGVVCGPLDESCFGYHVIDAKTGHVESDYAADREYTWAAAFYVYRDDRPTSQFDTLYWNSWGCWSDILSQHVFDLYRDCQPRRVSIEEVLKLTRSGIPSNLCQLKIDRKTNDRDRRLTLGDRYQFPPEHLGTSAQFIPKAGQSGATAGYIICVVIHSDALLSTDENAPDWSLNSELWVFDAECIDRGPLCRLSHPQLNLGFTLHTTWLPPQSSQNSSRPATRYEIRQDYRDLLQGQSDEIQALFEHEIYPFFD